MFKGLTENRENLAYRLHDVNLTKSKRFGHNVQSLVPYNVMAQSQSQGICSSYCLYESNTTP